MEIVVAEVVEPARRPWGFWATIGLSLAVLVTLVVVQAAVAVAFVAVPMLTNPRSVGGSRVEFAERGQDLSADGLLLAIATWAATPVCLALTVGFVKIRGGWSLRDYLALNPVPGKTVSLWLACALLFVVAWEVVSYLLGRPLVQEYMVKANETARWPPLLWSALLIAAPLFEETFFRGFMFRGIESSRLGGVGAIVITGLAWAMLHVQYDLFAIGTIFLGGLLFGAARWKSQSVYVTMAMHFLWNLISILEYEAYVRWFG